MRPYEEAIEAHREAMDMGTRERAELRQAQLARSEAIRTEQGGQGLRGMFPILMRMAIEVEPRLAAEKYLDEENALLTETIAEILDHPARFAKRSARVGVGILQDSVTAWASPDVVARAAQAHPSEVVVPSRQALPFERAFVLLGEPVRDEQDPGGWQVEAISWHVLNDQRVMARTYGRFTEEGRDPSLFPDMTGVQPFGKPLTVTEGWDALRSDEHGALAYRLMSLLCREQEEDVDTRVAVVDASGDKQAKRAARKAGMSTDVNVVYLQAEKKRALCGRSGPGSGSVVSHRVRGHWRWQPYGPERSLRRWQFIAEHERGSGAGADTSERVYVPRA